MNEATKRKTISPKTVAVSVLSELAEILQQRIESPEKFTPGPRALEAEHAFIRKFIAPLVHPEKRLNGNDLATHVFGLIETYGAEEIPKFFVAPIVVVAYFDQALRAEKLGHIQEAWVQVAEAKYWLGVLVGAETRGDVMVNAGSELERLIKLRASALGKIGAKNRHKPGNELKAWAIEKYKAGQWKSASQAAWELRGAILEHGEKIGKRLSESNAHNTIAEWFRKSV